MIINLLIADYLQARSKQKSWSVDGNIDKVTRSLTKRMFLSISLWLARISRAQENRFVSVATTGTDSGVRRKFSRGAKVLSQSRDVTKELYGECRRHDHSRVVRGHAPEKFCKITPKNTHFRAFWKQVLV